MENINFKPDISPKVSKGYTKNFIYCSPSRQRAFQFGLFGLVSMAISFILRLGLQENAKAVFESDRVLEHFT